VELTSGSAGTPAPVVGPEPVAPDPDPDPDPDPEPELELELDPELELELERPLCQARNPCRFPGLPRSWQTEDSGFRSG
jgi:hypothetical protein